MLRPGRSPAQGRRSLPASPATVPAKLLAAAPAPSAAPCRRGAPHRHHRRHHPRQPHAGHHRGGRAAGVPGRCVRGAAALAAVMQSRRLRAPLPALYLRVTRARALARVPPPPLVPCRRGGDVQRGCGHDGTQRPRPHPRQELQGGRQGPPPTVRRRCRPWLLLLGAGAAPARCLLGCKACAVASPPTHV